MQEMCIQPLDQEKPLEAGMATHSSILAWRTPCTEEPGGSAFIGSKRVEHDWSNIARMHARMETVWRLVLCSPFSNCHCIIINTADTLPSFLRYFLPTLCHHCPVSVFRPHILLGFPGGSDSKESACNVGDPGSIPGLGRSPGDGNGYHSSILAWRIPWTEEPGRLQSMRSQRVGHDWETCTSLQLLTFRGLSLGMKCCCAPDVHEADPKPRLCVLLL